LASEEATKKEVEMKKGLNPQDQVMFKKYVKEKFTPNEISKMLKVDVKVIKKWMRATTKKSESAAVKSVPEDTSKKEK
jgi:transposase